MEARKNVDLMEVTEELLFELEGFVLRDAEDKYFQIQRINEDVMMMEVTEALLYKQEGFVLHEQEELLLQSLQQQCCEEEDAAISDNDSAVVVEADILPPCSPMVEFPPNSPMAELSQPMAKSKPCPKAMPAFSSPLQGEDEIINEVEMDYTPPPDYGLSTDVGVEESPPVFEDFLNGLLSSSPMSVENTPPPFENTPPPFENTPPPFDDRPNGYVFFCNNASQRESEKRHLLGCPLSQLARMKKHIHEGTLLFLYNFETKRMLGTFVARHCPDENIDPIAFAGKFAAQCAASPLYGSLVIQAPIEEKMTGGPQTPAETAKLRELLAEKGLLADDKVQDAWLCAEQPVPGTFEDVDKIKVVVEKPKPKPAKVVAEKRSEPEASPDDELDDEPVVKRAKTMEMEEVVPAEEGGGAGGHVDDEAWKVAYVCVCNTAQYPESEKLKLLGSPDRDFPQMMRWIAPGTRIFLFNFETFQLLGPLQALSPPQEEISVVAFGRRFPSQVKVAPFDGEALLTMKYDRKLMAGVKLGAEATRLHEKLLLEGEILPIETQEAWASPDVTREHWTVAPVPEQMPRPRVVPKAGFTPKACAPTNGPVDTRHCDREGRPFNLNLCVVNFANVGASYAKNVLGRDNTRGDRLFDWEGVRRCIKLLVEQGMQCVGVLFENFSGPDNNNYRVKGVPTDIAKMCTSLQETPRLTGRNHKSADDEMTIKCAFRRNCRFLDNDNYRDWLSGLRDEKCRMWLEKHQDLMQMRYYFDSDLGNFDTLDGNVPVLTLAALKEPMKGPTGGKIDSAVLAARAAKAAGMR